MGVGERNRVREYARDSEADRAERAGVFEPARDVEDGLHSARDRGNVQHDGVRGFEVGREGEDARGLGRFHDVVVERSIGFRGADGDASD